MRRHDHQAGHTLRLATLTTGRGLTRLAMICAIAIGACLLDGCSSSPSLSDTATCMQFMSVTAQEQQQTVNDLAQQFNKQAYASATGV